MHNARTWIELFYHLWPGRKDEDIIQVHVIIRGSGTQKRLLTPRSHKKKQYITLKNLEYSVLKEGSVFRCLAGFHLRYYRFKAFRYSFPLSLFGMVPRTVALLAAILTYIIYLCTLVILIHTYSSTIQSHLKFHFKFRWLGFTLTWNQFVCTNKINL